MKEIILIKDGELALKGLNRSKFEAILTKNIRWRLKKYGEFLLRRSQSTMVIEPLQEEFDLGPVADELSRVFGIAGFSRAAAVQKDMGVILETAPVYLKPQLSEACTFKVEAKRSDKTFPLTSPEISAKVGEKLLNAFPNLSVNVHEPDLTVTVEVRDQYAFIRGDQLKGAGGLPAGSAGKAALLISGGIDSPVAGYMMARRGTALTCIHFASPPYTSVRSEQKVHELLSKVARYSGRLTLFTVPFTEIQETIRDKCPEYLFTLIMRRFMMRVASTIAKREECLALITGESVGQVASQTLPALICTDRASELPVFRPCIGMDKEDIIQISRKIGAFEISIEPFEDCCTVFTPKHPKTNPHLDELEKAEESLDVASLTLRASNGASKITVDAEGNIHEG